MKKITFLFLLCLMASAVTFGQFSQDFEDGSATPQFAYNGVGYGNAANPDATGINTSARVLEVNKPDSADWFAGMGFQDTGNVLVDLANGTTFKMKVWAPFVQSVRMRLQADLDTGANTAYNADVVVPSAMEWVEMTFDFSSFGNTTSQYQELVIAVNYDPACEAGGCTTVGAGNGGLWYIDDIVQEGGSAVDPNTDATLSDLTVDGVTVAAFSPNTTSYTVELPNGTTTVPVVAGVATQAGSGSSNVAVTQATAIPGTATVDVTAPNGTDTEQYIVNFTEAAALPPAAPTPTNSPAIGVITDVHTNVAIPQVDVFGGSTANLDLNGDSNDETITVTGGSGFQYNFFPGGAQIDISAATMMHLDFYAEGITDGDVLRVRLLASDTNIFNIARVTVNASDSGNWVSVDLTLPSGTDFGDFGDVDSSSTVVDLTDIALIQINTLDLGSNLANLDVYLSNIYFYGGTVASVDDNALFEAKAFPNPSSTNWTISTPNNTIKTVQVFNVLGREVASQTVNDNTANISVVNLASGVYLARVTTDAGTKTMKLIRE